MIIDILFSIVLLSICWMLYRHVGIFFVSTYMSTNVVSTTALVETLWPVTRFEYLAECDSSQSSVSVKGVKSETAQSSLEWYWDIVACNSIWVFSWVWLKSIQCQRQSGEIRISAWSSLEWPLSIMACNLIWVLNWVWLKSIKCQSQSGEIRNFHFGTLQTNFSGSILSFPPPLLQFHNFLFSLSIFPFPCLSFPFPPLFPPLPPFFPPFPLPSKISPKLSKGGRLP